MNKISRLILVAAGLLALSRPAAARICGSMVHNDLWANGGRVVNGSCSSTTEIAQDVNGHLVPTTNNVLQLGLSTLQWSDVETTAINSGGGAVAVGGGSGTTPLMTFSPNLSSNTVSGALNTTITQTTLGLCLAGSTVTLKTPPSGTLIEVFTNLTSSVSVTGSTVTVGILLNGAYVNGESPSLGLVAAGNGIGVGGNLLNLSFTTLLSGLTASTSNNICLTAASSAGTLSVSSVGSAVSKLTAVILP